MQSFFRGILCNILVDLAVILAIAADTVEGKILGIFFPIMTFVAIGFEHSVANMSLIPIGLFIKAASNFGPETLNWAGFWKNVLGATLGNIVGPGILSQPFITSVTTNRAFNPKLERLTTLSPQQGRCALRWQL